MTRSGTIEITTNSHQKVLALSLITLLKSVWFRFMTKVATQIKPKIAEYRKKIKTSWGMNLASISITLILTYTFLVWPFREKFVILRCEIKRAKRSGRLSFKRVCNR